MGNLRRTCATVPQPSELRFGVVRAVGRGIAVLDVSLCRARGGGGFEVLFPIFTMRNVIGSPTVKCFRFVCENLTTFSFGKPIVGKLDSWLFGDIFTYKINVWVYEKLAKKSDDCCTKT